MINPVTKSIDVDVLNKTHNVLLKSRENVFDLIKYNENDADIFSEKKRTSINNMYFDELENVNKLLEYYGDV